MTTSAEDGPPRFAINCKDTTGVSAAIIPERRMLSVANAITLESDLPIYIPISPAELELVRIYFGDLIQAALERDK
jgi:hypothetical protein